MTGWGPIGEQTTVAPWEEPERRPEPDEDEPIDWVALGYGATLVLGILVVVAVGRATTNWMAGWVAMTGVWLVGFAALGTAEAHGQAHANGGRDLPDWSQLTSATATLQRAHDVLSTLERCKKGHGIQVKDQATGKCQRCARSEQIQARARRKQEA